MNEAEKILEKFARKNMVQWNQESFKRTHSRLHKSIIEAINEALNLHNVVERSEQLVCPYCGVVKSSCDLTDIELKNKIRLADIDYHLKKERS
jgi:hypothetical protein